MSDAASLDLGPRIKTGDAILTEGRSLFGRAIRCRTHSRFSHVSMAVWVQIAGPGGTTSWRLGVAEALDWAGVRLYPLDEYLRDCGRRGELVHWYALTDPKINRLHAAQFVLGQWGRRYASWTQFAASYARWSRPLWRLVGLKDRDTDPFRWHCSELYSSALFYGGYYPPAGDETAPWRITPGDVSLFPCLQRRRLLTVEDAQLLACGGARD